MHFTYFPIVAYLALSPIVSAGVCKHRQGKNSTSSASASASKQAPSSTSAISSAIFAASSASSATSSSASLAWDSSSAASSGSASSTGGDLLASPTSISSRSSATGNWTSSLITFNLTRTLPAASHTGSSDMWNCTESRASSSQSWSSTWTSQSADPTAPHTGGDLLASPTSISSNSSATSSRASSSKVSSRSSSSSERNTSTSKSATATSTASSGDVGSSVSSQTYSGVASYYYPSGGPGNCGGDIQNSDAVVAINYAQYFAEMQSNGWQSVLCGRQVHITAAGTGVSVVATIQDSCPGCGKNSLDLTVDLWNQMNAQAGHKFNGLFNIEWYFL